jgi:hypothetical protein
MVDLETEMEKCSENEYFIGSLADLKKALKNGPVVVHSIRNSVKKINESRERNGVSYIEVIRRPTENSGIAARAYIAFSGLCGKIYKKIYSMPDDLKVCVLGVSAITLFASTVSLYQGNEKVMDWNGIDIDRAVDDSASVVKTNENLEGATEKVNEEGHRYYEGVFGDFKER